ncbi:hypothetical protein JCM11251_007226 [Rhodosporidiobolus azoricus]
MEPTTATRPPLPDSPTSPSASVASSTTSSWPATDLGSSERGDVSNMVTPAPASPGEVPLVGSASPSPGPAALPALPSLDTSSLAQTPSSADSSTANVDQATTLATPASATWSRSRLPEGEETDLEGGLTPIDESKVEQALKAESRGDNEPVEVEEEEAKNEVKADMAKEEQQKILEKQEGIEPVKEEQPAETTTASPVSARPAFVLTRPTLSGENETVSITQPSTPSTSVKGDNDDKEEDPKKDNKKGEAKVATRGSSAHSATEPKKKDSQSIKLDTAFLNETKASGAFFASPAPFTAVTPSRTAAFFSSDFHIQLPSPPRSGGAFITELASDVESIAEKVAHAVFPDASPAKKNNEDEERPTSDSRSRNLSQFSSRHEPQEHGKQRSMSRNLRSSRPSHSRSRSRNRQDDDRPYRQQNHQRHTGQYGVQSSDSPSSESDDEELSRQPRLPIVHSRTIVSARIVKLPSSSRRDAPSASRREQVQQRDRDVYPRTDDSFNQEAPAPPARPSGEKPLNALLGEVKAALKKEPAAFYAIKGVLAEFEEEQRERRREADRQQEQRRHRDEQSPAVYRNPKRDSHAPPTPRPTSHRKYKESEGAARRQEKPHKVVAPLLPRAPVHRYSLTQTSDEGSDTEIEPVKKPAPRPAYQYRAPQVARLDHSYDLGHGLVLPAAPPPPASLAVQAPMAKGHAQSPSPPEYPLHLSPGKVKSHGKAKGATRLVRDRAEKDYPLVARKTSGGPAPPAPLVVKPVPVRPHDRFDQIKREERQEREKRFPSPPRGETLTVAQAAKLAEGLGRDDEAERLRRSGLKGRDKVSKMEGGKGSKGGNDQVKANEKTKLRRRHSFDSVLEFVPHAPWKTNDKARKNVRYGDLTKPSSAFNGERDLPFRLKSFHLPSSSLDRIEPPLVQSATPKGAAQVLAAAFAASVPRVLVDGGQTGTKDAAREGEVYSSPTVENGKKPHFYFGRGDLKDVGRKGKEREELSFKKDEGRRKRGRELSVPQSAGGGAKKPERVAGASGFKIPSPARFDFDDFM